MRTGSLRHCVKLQRQDLAGRGSAGQAIAAWVDVTDTWVEIEPLTANQRVTAQAIHPDVSHKITARYRPDYATPQLICKLRIIYKGRIFALRGGLNIDERNKQVELVASEGINDG